MKRTEGDLRQSLGRSFLRKICTGVIAGAIIALTAVPAMASDYELRFEFPNRTIHSGSVNVYKVLDIVGEVGDNKAEINYAKGFEGLFKTDAELNDFVTFLNGENGDPQFFRSEQYRSYMDQVREKINANGVTGITVDLAAAEKKADVDGLGLYYVGVPNTNTFILNLTGTNNRKGDVSVNGFFVSLTEENKNDAGIYVRTSMPKPEVIDPPGGGNAEIGGEQFVFQPAEGFLVPFFHLGEQSGDLASDGYGGLFQSALEGIENRHHCPAFLVRTEGSFVPGGSWSLMVFSRPLMKSPDLPELKSLAISIASSMLTTAGMSGQ